MLSSHLLPDTVCRSYPVTFSDPALPQTPHLVRYSWIADLAAVCHKLFSSLLFFITTLQQTRTYPSRTSNFAIGLLYRARVLYCKVDQKSSWAPWITTNRPSWTWLLVNALPPIVIIGRYLARTIAQSVRSQRSKSVRPCCLANTTHERRRLMIEVNNPTAQSQNPGLINRYLSLRERYAEYRRRMAVEVYEPNQVMDIKRIVVFD